MNTKTISITTLALLPAALFSRTACSSTSTPPPPVGSAVRIHTQGVLGGTVVQTVKMTATLTAIDQAKRTATILASDGKTFPVKAGPEAVNFDQVRVGDQVTATLTEKVVVSLDDKEAPSSEGAAAVVARAAKGDQQGGLVAGITQVTAKVIALDLEQRTATLQFDDGITQTLRVRADVDLSHLKVVEQVVFRVTEKIAINVEKVP